MTYSAQPPSEPGYYWLKTGENEEIVEVWTDPEKNPRSLWIHRCGDGDCCGIATLADSHWAGPIQKPD